MSRDIIKYPRTRHVQGSRFQHGDHDLEAVPWSDLSGRYLVVEEKMDGSNVGVSFDDEANILLQSRGHYLRGGPREKQYELLKQWTACHSDSLYCILGTRYVMYGEWLYAKHTIFYDALPHYFMEFDVLDTENNTFLSTTRRKELLKDLPVTSVRVLCEGPISTLDACAELIGRSAFFSHDLSVRRDLFLLEAHRSGLLPQKHDASFVNDDEFRALKTCDWSPFMEGLYIKWEEDGIVKGRYKFVRDSFTNSIIEQDAHWADRPIVKNVLMPGAFENMFK